MRQRSGGGEVSMGGTCLMPQDWQELIVSLRFSEEARGPERKGSIRSGLEGSLWLDRKDVAGQQEELGLF